MTRALIFFLAALILSTGPLSAQTTYSIATESAISVDGTSNKSDWTVTAEEFTGWFTVEDGEPVSVELIIPVMQMKGGKSLIMDRLMRNALNAEKYAEITFDSTHVESRDDGGWNVTGDLTISGETREVLVPIDRVETGRYVGQVELKMSDFGVKPPVAMFGALRTADEIIVNLDILGQESREN